MEVVSGLNHARVILPPQRTPAGWASNPVLAFWRTEISLAPTGVPTPDSPARLWQRKCYWHLLTDRQTEFPLLVNMSYFLSSALVVWKGIALFADSPFVIRLFLW
jgi:hypothetical protein